MHRGFFLPVKALPPAPNGLETGGGRCHATYLCGERFNSRPPRGERQKNPCLWYTWGAFQSTLSARRATKDWTSVGKFVLISIHALREEGDVDEDTVERMERAISIHALREEGDKVWPGLLPLSFNFYPRPPRGGRLGSQAREVVAEAFLSTPSARRATRGSLYIRQTSAISIHALREEGDFTTVRASPPRSNFYPRPPRGGRQQKQRKNPCFYSIINHSAQNGKSCNCAEHERCVFCGQNIRFSGAKKTEKA